MKRFKCTLNVFYVFVIILFFNSCASEQNKDMLSQWDTSINFDWKFSKGDIPESINPDFNDSLWESVDLPHDWAISGPFDSPESAGHTGKLPWKGEGWYRKTFELPADANDKQFQLLFDGIMANPTIYVNGEKVGSWRYGYNSFWVDATKAVKFGEKNILTIHADTREHTSRWYPGAGIFRKISMRLVNPIHIPVWGIYITTPEVNSDEAIVKLNTEVSNKSTENKTVNLEINIFDPSGTIVSNTSKETEVKSGETAITEEEIKLSQPQLWDIESPDLYICQTILSVDGKIVQTEETNFGIRTFEWTANDGFHLNGRRVQLQGVNLHHDQGPLGAAFFPRSMERQLEIMKEMGVNALRTSHNACAPEVLDLCDKMGIIVFNELFDKYGPTASIQCSTREFVNNYAEAEVTNFVRRDRNHSCVFIWSIGNEIPEILNNEDGEAAEHVAKMVEYFKKYDTTRPTTMGCHISEVSEGDKHILDAVKTSGWNYARRYVSTRKAYPEMPLIYSESASAFGTRGAYKLELPKSKIDWGTNDGNITAYMLTSAQWSDIPEVEFEYMRIDTFMAGEFVWTGFDYLGEPTPYQLGEWLKGIRTKEGALARSSYFGIVDLAGLPKDSYYNYRSLWNKKENTVYLAPHWNWSGHEGEKIPVFVYTDGDEAELFLNGKSYGKKQKIDPNTTKLSQSIANKFEFVVTENDKENPYYDIVDAYRIRWFDVPYEPGELTVVAYKNGEKIGEATVKTAGEAKQLRLTPDRNTLKADGMDLCYITIEMVDENNVVCPLAMDNLEFSVNGAAKLMGVANGNSMGHDSFTDATHPLFYGKAVAVLRNIPGQAGIATLSVKSEGGIESQIEINFIKN